MHGMPLALRGKSHRQKKIIPIIIVPNAATALINIHNAKDFLEDGVPAILGAGKPHVLCERAVPQPWSFSKRSLRVHSQRRGSGTLGKWEGGGSRVMFWLCRRLVQGTQL